MGIGDFVDSGLGKLEDGIDAGKKLVGEGVDQGANAVSDRLDDMGAHDWADKVDAAVDSIASDLGATPDEQQLGRTDLPTQLVHGDPADIRRTADHLQDFHTAFDTVGQGMRKLDSSAWKGEAAETFREKFAMHPVKWLHAADACDRAARALTAYADTVEWAQGQARDAINLYQAGKEADDKAAVARAKEILGEARRQRDDAAGTAAASVRAALAHAPAEPPPLKRLKSDWDDGLAAVNTELTHFTGGVFKGAAGLINSARGMNPLDPYNLAHPAEHLQNVSMTLSGLVSTAAHPERAAKTAWEDFKKDPLEFGGRLVPEAVGTKGTGLGRGGLQTTVKARMEEAAQRAARNDAKGVADHSAADTARTRPQENDTANPSEQVEKDPTDPVDLSTGKMYLPQTDATLPGALPLVFKRRVESGYHYGRWFGPSWSSTLDQRLEIDSEGVVFVTEDGLLLAYPHPAPGLPTLPSHGPRWPLDREDGGYTVTDPRTRRAWHFADRGDGLAILERIDDRNGNWITFEYDAEGTPLGIVSSAGYDVRVSTEEDRVTALRLSAADQVLMCYGYTEGNLTEVVNSSGLPLRFTYDESGRVTSWTDTNDRGYTYEYDDQDRCIAEGGTHGHMALRLSYEERDPDTGLRVTTVTTAVGHTRRYVVNDSCQVVAEFDALGAVTRFQRDRYNRLLSRTDPLGHVTTFRYDDTGNLLTLTRPDGREAKAEYNELGLPVKVVRTDGTVVRQTYDERGNRTSMTTSSGQTT
ncbi:type IV secretion protein Rhs, partial [Streptomyces sp. MMG1533]|uniref:putative T7SS-secreted protein n=1 Tax=Streptomyces sp. MMG1533 TaxID=1415546 RepID=UPI0006C2F09F